MAEKFKQAEIDPAEWAKSHSIQYTILRPTMIYGRGLDRNVSQIASIVRRFGFFPLFGPARGLRQPIHVDDVALACVRSLEGAKSSTYNISGGERLTYREMVIRIFQARKEAMLTARAFMDLSRSKAALLVPAIRRLVAHNGRTYE